MTFAVELAEMPGQVLSVRTALPRPDNWLGLRSEPITPRMVEQAIRAARLAGWEPHKSGNAFKFSFRTERPDRAARPARRPMPGEARQQAERDRPRAALARRLDSEQANSAVQT
ncbi:hypothetical protein [Actinoplanes sp. G11-F43]|uniref:hypothetical protein n=1 Tax=Actinoplanes sp. G11-F43 TaxID=3424130 RepID=UPI003D32A2DC